MNYLFPDDFHTIGGLSGLGEDLPTIPEVARWFASIPGADPLADRAKLEYYQKAGRDALIADVAAGGYGADPNRNLPSLDTVNQWFQNTPGANPYPSIYDLNYYRSKSQAQLAADVAAVRAANPAAAAQIDAQRKALQLPPFTAAEVQARRAQVLQWFQQTPGADPQPDPATLDYYADAGRAQLVADVAAVRASNPSEAARIDELRARFGLPMAAPIVSTVMPPPSDTITTKPGDVVVIRPDTQSTSWYDEIGQVICSRVQPLYSKKLPLPAIDHDAIGFLYGQGPTDRPWQCPFNLKKGDPIPLNWQEDFASTVPDVIIDCMPGYMPKDGQCVPIPGYVGPKPPTPAAGGVGTLILAAAAAYLLGS